MVGGDHGRGRRAATTWPQPPYGVATTWASYPRTTPSSPSTRRSPTRPSSLALRRHAGRSKVVVSPEGRVVERSGKDLREVDLLVGSGGVLRHGRPGVAERVFAGSVGEVDGGWQLPRRAEVVVDADYVLAAAGLLASGHRDAAAALVSRLAPAATA